MRPVTVTSGLSYAACAGAVAVFALSPAIAGSDQVRVRGIFTSWSSAVPQGATGEVEAVYDAVGDSTVTLAVQGLRPRTEYAVHAHEGPCDATGPHVQNVPTTDTHPAFAERNEIRIPLETDRTGGAVGSTTVAWQLPPGREVRSLVLHAVRTVEIPHHPPTTFATVGRLACLDVDLH